VSVVTEDGETIDRTYSKRLGERLRAIRRQQGLSLHDVEAQSNQEFKASVLGAYERSERAISVPRLQRLAKLYKVPVDQLLPREPGEVVVDLDAEAAASAAPGGEASQRPQWRYGAEENVTIDLVKLQQLSEPEAEILTRYLRMIQLQRQDFNGRVLSIRRDDVRALACMFEVHPDAMRRRLAEMGLSSANQ
jgi:transcriptional regulator with XRE-family HTH domain